MPRNKKSVEEKIASVIKKIRKEQNPGNGLRYGGFRECCGAAEIGGLPYNNVVTEAAMYRVLLSLKSLGWADGIPKLLIATTQGAQKSARTILNVISRENIPFIGSTGNKLELHIIDKATLRKELC